MLEGQYYGSILGNVLEENTSVEEEQSLFNMCYGTTTSFTVEAKLDSESSISNLLAEILYQQDKIFISRLQNCVRETGNSTSTVYSMDRRAFETVRYLVECKRKSATHLLFNRAVLSDLVNDESFKEEINMCCSRELLLSGCIGNVRYTQFVTTAGTCVEEPISPEIVYALSANGNSYTTKTKVSYNKETDIVTVTRDVTLYIEPWSVASLTIFKNI